MALKAIVLNATIDAKKGARNATNNSLESILWQFAIPPPLKF